MYDYLANLQTDIEAELGSSEDVNEIIKEEGIEDRDELIEHLAYILWDNDDVTGNGSTTGYYTGLTENQRKQAVLDNWELGVSALEEFGSELKDLRDLDFVDTTIRCYLLDEALDNYLDTLKLDFNEGGEE